MSKKYTPLYVAYDLQRGQIPYFGGSPEIANALEPLGTGMEVSEPWGRGGPIVWRPLHGRRLVGWMRGIPTTAVDRHGAWECWGLLVDDDVDIAAWPCLLMRLSQSIDEANLDALGERLLKKQGDATPTQPGELATVLTALHRHQRSGAQPPMTIPLVSMHATALVPWVWLLGPYDPQEAYLGPPRKTPAAASPQLTYHATIGAAFPDNEPAKQVSDELNDLKGKPSLEAAIQLGKRLRGPKAEWFARPAVEASYRNVPPFLRKDAYAPDDETETSQTNERVPWHTKLLAPFRANWKWLPILPWAIVILLLLNITRYLGPMRYDITNIRNTVHTAPSDSAKHPDGSAGRSGQGTGVTSTAAVTDTATTTRTASANPAQPTTDVIREMITRGVPGVTFMPKIKSVALKGALTPDDQTKLHIAAIQTVFVKRGWTTDKKIDGSAGSGFFAALKQAGSSSDFARLLTDDQYLVAELQKR